MKPSRIPLLIQDKCVLFQVFAHSFSWSGNQPVFGVYCMPNTVLGTEYTLAREGNMVSVLLKFMASQKRERLWKQVGWSLGTWIPKHGFTYDWASQTPRNLFWAYSTDALVPSNIICKWLSSHSWKIIKEKFKKQ